MMQKMVLSGLLAGLAVSVALLTGCGGGGGGGGPDAAELTAQGWTHYEQAEYEEALGKFDAAVEADPSYADAYNGLGWTCCKLDSLAEAAAAFGLCISNGETGAEPYAGLAAVYRDTDPPRFQDVITAATTALAKDPNFEFEHYEDFDWHDLRVLLAQSYFELQDYDQALAQVDILYPSNSLDPDRDGFVADLGVAIELMEKDFGN